MKNDYQLIIIGAGSGGLTAAEFAHKLGLKRVAIVEKDDRLGGECLHTGCVPSKALLHAAKTGLKDPWKHVQASIKYIEDRSDNDDHLASLGIDVLHGAASFTGKRTIEIAGRTYKSQYFLIASGSHPFVPPIPGLEDIDYLTNENFFQQKQAPKRLAIIGSGPIGSEMATAMSALGTKVTLIEQGDRILSRIDPATAQLVADNLAARKVNIVTKAELKRVSRAGKSIRLELGSGNVLVDQVLVATGRRPNTDLNLDAAKVEVGSQGITIDKYLRTTNSRIYAVGDCTPSPKFTHLAGHQAALALGNMLNPLYQMSAERLVPTPAITYTWPEIGGFGIPKEDALAQKDSMHLRYDLTDNDRIVTDQAEPGFVEVVLDKKGRLLHGTVAADNASEVLAPLLVLYGNKRSVTDLANVVFPYPTVAGIVSNIASDYATKRITSVPGWGVITRKWR